MHGDSVVKAGREPRGSNSDSQLPTSFPGTQPSLKLHAIPQLPGLMHAKLQGLSGLGVNKSWAPKSPQAFALVPSYLPHPSIPSLF